MRRRQLLRGSKRSPFWVGGGGGGAAGVEQSGGRGDGGSRERRKVVGTGVPEKWRQWEVGGGAKAASCFSGELPSAALDAVAAKDRTQRIECNK